MDIDIFYLYLFKIKVINEIKINF